MGVLWVAAVFLGTGASVLYGEEPPARTDPFQSAQTEQMEKYLDARLEAAFQAREAHWHRDFSSVEAYRESVEPNRADLVRAVGGIPERDAAGEPRTLGVGEKPGYTIQRVWLPVTGGIEVYGILLLPERAQPGPALICLHGLDGTPEQVCGMGESDYTLQFGARAAEAGYVVFAPSLTANPTDRIRLDRKARLLGTQLLGLEEAKMLRILDYLGTVSQVDPDRIGIYGISWGGRLALYTAALDPRVAAVVVSGHFNQTYRKLVVPSPDYRTYLDTDEEYAFIPALIQEFSDSDIASLILPRPIFIEQGKQDRVVSYQVAREEFDRLQDFYRRLGVEDRCAFGLFDGGHVAHGVDAFKFLDRWLAAD